MASILGGLAFSEQLLLSFALGEAASPALRPYTQDLANLAWSSNSVLPPDAYQLAVGVAQGQIPLSQAQGWANEQGISNSAFSALVNAANTGPALGYAYQAWRRGDLNDTEFQTALTRQAIEPQWFAAMEALKAERLDLGAIATAVHRGIMQEQGLLVTPVPSGSGNVPRIPVSPLDTTAEFAAHGIDHERARILVADTGLPLSLGEMLRLYNRGKVTATDVQVSIAESNVRNEYMTVALDLARHILTPHEYAEAELRGVIPDGSPGAALSGLTAADYQTLFGLLGRPLNVHEVTTALARGGQFNPNATDYSAVPSGPYRDAIRRSNIRPEYADLAFHNRYLFPSAFVLRSLAQAGDLGGQAQVQTVLEEIGWSPTFAQQVSTAWVGTTSDPHVAKAQNQLWTTAHRSFVSAEIDAPTATAAITTAGVPAASTGAVISLWTHERSLIRKQLTPAQVKKAYKDGLYTLQQAMTALLDRGYDQPEATTLLQE